MSSDPAIATMILRGKVVNSAVNGRTLNQATVLDEDVRDLVEHLNPPGYFGKPSAGADILELQIGGYASHKVHVGGDNTADIPTDVLDGEYGLAYGGKQIAIRVDGVELIAALLRWGPARNALKRLVQEEFVALYNMHTHSDPQGGNSGVPNQQMTAAHLTGGT